MLEDLLPVLQVSEYLTHQEGMVAPARSGYIGKVDNHPKRSEKN